MRLVFPIVIVAAAAGLVDPRRHRPGAQRAATLYAQNLEEANPIDRGLRRHVPADGVPQLLLRRRQGRALAAPIERPLAGVGRHRRRSRRRSLRRRCCSSRSSSPRRASRRARRRARRPRLLPRRQRPRRRWSPTTTRTKRRRSRRPRRASTDGPTGAQAAAAARRRRRAASRASSTSRCSTRRSRFDGVIGAFAISKDIIVIARRPRPRRALHPDADRLPRAPGHARRVPLPRARRALGDRRLAVLLFISIEVPRSRGGHRHDRRGAHHRARSSPRVRANREEEDEDGELRRPPTSATRPRSKDHDGHRLQQAAEAADPAPPAPISTRGAGAAGLDARRAGRR